MATNTPQACSFLLDIDSLFIYNVMTIFFMKYLLTWPEKMIFRVLAYSNLFHTKPETFITFIILVLFFFAT